MARIEVALATYNGARFLPELLNSLARQTRMPDLIRVGDDGSSDETLPLLASLRAGGMPIEVLEDGGCGLGAAANFGRVLAHCNADYVLLADQDDVWHPEKIEKLTVLLESVEGQEGASLPILVYSDARLVHQNGDFMAESAAGFQGFCLGSGLHFHRMLVQNVVPGCTMMFNRALLEAALPVPAEAVMHDWWLLLVASGLGRVAMLDTPLVDYRQHDQNTLGAQYWDAANVFTKLRHGPTRARARVRAGFEAAVRQAQCLHGRLAGDLPASHRAVLEAILSLDDMGPFAKRWQAVRWGLRKEGLLRTLAFYYAL